jgi:hypothetical protein
MPCDSAHTAPAYSTPARSTLRRFNSAKKDGRSATATLRSRRRQAGFQRAEFPSAGPCCTSAETIPFDESAWAARVSIKCAVRRHAFPMPASNPKVGFVSLGCPKALVDSERILTQLKAEGYEIVPRYDKANAVIVNTCGFIDAAVAEKLDAIGAALE